ncbi:MAG: methyltransferase domain-containing protein [Candidatus Kerfeldbacteria bacterium]|nr:methyltransferase domain-containing protein [Candidatus Kerfeldbacteria bacterium]
MSKSPSQPPAENLAEWNNEMFLKHPTPYTGLAGRVEKKRAEAIAKEIRERKSNDQFSLLEIGCEAGRLLSILRSFFPRAKFYGQDISTVALDEARKNLGDGVVLEQSDLASEQMELHIPNLNFIVCSETLEHIPDINAAVANLKKIATPEQYVIITVPYEKTKNNIKIILNRLKIFDFLMKGIEKEFSEWHVNDFSKEDLYRLFGDEFEILKYKKIYALHQLLVMRKKA